MRAADVAMIWLRPTMNNFSYSEKSVASNVSDNIVTCFDIYGFDQMNVVCFLQGTHTHTHTHTHNRFTAGLEYVRVHPGQQVPER